MLGTLAAQAETRTPAIEEMIRAHIETGDIEMTAGNLEAAKEFFRNAAALSDSVVVSPYTQVYVQFRLGDIEAQQGAPGAALPYFRKARERAQDWVATSRDPEALRSLRGSYSRLANASRESGDLFACRDNLLKAQQLVEAGLRQTNRSLEDRRNLMSTYMVLGDVQNGPDDLNLGDYHAALSNYRAALAIIEEMVSEDPHDMRARRDLAISHRRVGLILFEKAPAEALKHYVKALEIAEELRVLDPVNIDFRRDVMEANLGLGVLYRKSGRKDDAIERLTRALELQKSIDATAPYRIWLARYTTQNLYRDRKRANDGWGPDRSNEPLSGGVEGGGRTPQTRADQLVSGKGPGGCG
jgi:tetratricopeptide (TPR) repeat protein